MTTAVRCDVVVVGAGIAGLVAADRLSRAGLDVVCLEARDRVGGRASSVTSEHGTVDLGATWFWANEPLVPAYLERLALGEFAQATSGDALLETGTGPPQRLSGNPIDVASARFSDGAQALADALARGLPAGAVRLRDPVHWVGVGARHAVVAAARTTVMADHVIAALPPGLAAERIAFTPELPPTVSATAARTATWMADVVKAVAVYERPFWRGEGLAGAALSHRGPFQEVHDHSGLAGRPAALFGFAPSRRLAASDGNAIAAAFVGQLERLFGPEASTPVAVHVTDWSREHHTAVSSPVAGAGMGTYGHPVFQQPVAGRLYWASTETATAFAGHVEGAIRAGLAAAERVVRDRTLAAGASGRLQRASDDDRS